MAGSRQVCSMCGVQACHATQTNRLRTRGLLCVAFYLHVSRVAFGCMLAFSYGMEIDQSLLKLTVHSNQDLGYDNTIINQLQQGLGCLNVTP